MSVADQLKSYLRARLEQIRLGNTVALLDGQVYAFQTDAGQQVDLNLEYTEHPDVIPSLVLYTGKNSTVVDETVELGMESHLQEFSVEGFIYCDKAGTEAEALRQDISCAIKSDPFCGGLVEELRGAESETAIQIGEEISAVVKFSAQALYTVPFGSE